MTVPMKMSATNRVFFFPLTGRVGLASSDDRFWNRIDHFFRFFHIVLQAELNNMPPSNLGIVFGPTLLRTSEGSASLSSLVDTVHQVRLAPSE